MFRDPLSQAHNAQAWIAGIFKKQTIASRCYQRSGF